MIGKERKCKSTTHNNDVSVKNSWADGEWLMHVRTLGVTEKKTWYR